MLVLYLYEHQVYSQPISPCMIKRSGPNVKSRPNPKYLIQLRDQGPVSSRGPYQVDNSPSILDSSNTNFGSNK